MGWLETLIGAAGTGGPLGALIGQGASEATSGDTGQDLLSMLHGGQTSEEEAIMRDRINAILQGYGGAEGRIGDQYIGPLQGDIKEITDIRNLLDKGASMGVNMTPEERVELQNKLTQLESNIEEKLTFRPDFYVPQKSYDVETYSPETYTPESATAQSESFWQALNPERFAIPEYESAVMQDPSLAARALADAEGMDAQRGALSGYQDIYDQGGLTAIDRARMEDIRRRNQMQERASREAILADMERRGISGSGVELAARLANQQGSAERQAQEALGVEALAEQRKERALGNIGTMGRDLAEDVYRREFQTGSAQDIINQFNTLGARDVQSAQRNAQDAYSDWQRGMLGRDVDRLANAQRYNTVAANEAAQWNAANQTGANQWNAANQNAANQWGANARNQGMMFNTANQTAANQLNAQNAWNQLMGWNTQQGNLGNLDISKAMTLAGIYGQQPTADYGQLANNLWNINAAIGNEVQNAIPWTSMGKNLPGGGGSQPVMSPIQGNQGINTR